MLADMDSSKLQARMSGRLILICQASTRIEDLHERVEQAMGAHSDLPQYYARSSNSTPQAAVSPQRL